MAARNNYITNWVQQRKMIDSQFNFDKFLQEQRKPGVYAENPIVLSLANYYQVDLFIMSPESIDNQLPLFGSLTDSSRSVKPIFHLGLANQHYQSYIPEEGVGGFAAPREKHVDPDLPIQTPAPNLDHDYFNDPQPSMVDDVEGVFPEGMETSHSNDNTEYTEDLNGSSGSSRENVDKANSGESRDNTRNNDRNEHTYSVHEKSKKESNAKVYCSVNEKFLKDLTRRYIGSTTNEGMKTASGKRKVPQCKNQHNHEILEEWFEKTIDGRLRAKTLDAFGYLKEENCSRKENNQLQDIYTYKCIVDDCGAHLTLREVSPNLNKKLGLHGCLAHSHELKIEDNHLEIIFKDYKSAENFYLHHLEDEFTKDHKRRGMKDYRRFVCKRSKSTLEEAHVDCDSAFIFKTSFPISGPDVNIESLPHTIKGRFFHNHERELRFLRLQKIVKDVIDDKLAQGVPPSRIYKV